ncbi:hypothetical protein [Paracoccus sp. KR1-242]|uniref:hypothetical protein n=1 Tax=Paracoccus sp. KR1-242 TaxID=3410028 RepID=UPI003BFF5E8F
MRMLAPACLAVIATFGPAPPAAAQTLLFQGATESDDQLRELYDQAGDLCLHNPSPDVRIAVACKSMLIYGLALNERGWCLGHEAEPNALKAWHRCEAGSDRFSRDQLTLF